MRIPHSIRRKLDPFFTNIRVPVLGGPNRGMWWCVLSAGGYVMGRRDKGEMGLLSSLLAPGDIVWDVGAHHGAMTLCASRLVGEKGQVHAFEPSAVNRAVLDRHIRWNRCRNVRVHPFALSGRDGNDKFGGRGTSRTYALGKGTEVVAVRSAVTLVRQGILPPPTFMKIDVEGAEVGVITGAVEILPRDARLFIEIHSVDNDEQCSKPLLALGFQIYASSGLKRTRASGRWDSGCDLFCMGPDHAYRERDAQSLEFWDF
ncbi:FkbM family methyltransferase [Thermodesulfobacteriota bacterium]